MILYTELKKPENKIVIVDGIEWAQWAGVMRDVDTVRARWIYCTKDGTVIDISNGDIVSVLQPTFTIFDIKTLISIGTKLYPETAEKKGKDSNPPGFYIVNVKGRKQWVSASTIIWEAWHGVQESRPKLMRLDGKEKNFALNNLALR